jgi:hypothetical protein
VVVNNYPRLILYGVMIFSGFIMGCGVGWTVKLRKILAMLCGLIGGEIGYIFVNYYIP